MHTCTKVFHEIPFAHRQHRHEGHCQYIHGHNWSIAVTFKAQERDKNGFVMDFGDLDFMREWIGDWLDHSLLLNSDDPHLHWMQDHFGDENAEPMLAKVTVVPDGSCEGIAEWIHMAWDPMVREWTKGRVYISSITVHEDSNNSATYVP